MKPTRIGTLKDLERIKSRLSRAYVKGEVNKEVFSEMMEAVNTLETLVNKNCSAGEVDSIDQ